MRPRGSGDSSEVNPAFSIGVGGLAEDAHEQGVLEPRSRKQVEIGSDLVELEVLLARTPPADPKAGELKAPHVLRKTVVGVARSNRDDHVDVVEARDFASKSCQGVLPCRRRGRLVETVDDYWQALASPGTCRIERLEEFIDLHRAVSCN